MLAGVLPILGLCFLHGTHSIPFEALRELSLIKNITQLFDVVHMRRDGHRVQLNDVLPYFAMAEDGDQMYVSPGMAELAIPDECSPRLSTVVVPRPPPSSNAIRDESASEIIWPTCTRVRRCGGCCANTMLKCVSRTTRPKLVTVLKAMIYDSNNPQVFMDWQGPVQVEVEEHMDCDILCRITAADCNSRQHFDAFACSCTCRRPQLCRPWQRWDIETCMCVCKERTTACAPGTYFSDTTCRCLIDRNQQYSNLDVEDGQESVELTTIQKLTTPTTPSTTADPCADQFCPSMFLKIPDGNRCVCRPNFSYGRKK